MVNHKSVHMYFFGTVYSLNGPPTPLATYGDSYSLILSSAEWVPRKKEFILSFLSETALHKNSQ